MPVRLQRHRAWDPFLCTSSQSLAVHLPCWSALYPEESEVYPFIQDVSHHTQRFVRWRGRERVPGAREQRGPNLYSGVDRDLRDRPGHLLEVDRDKRFPEGGPHGPGGSHCTQIALLRFAVCSRRNSRLIGDTRTPLRKLRPWKTATLTTGEFITGFWGSLRRDPSGLGHC